MSFDAGLKVPGARGQPSSAMLCLEASEDNQSPAACADVGEGSAGDAMVLVMFRPSSDDPCQESALTPIGESSFHRFRKMTR